MVSKRVKELQVKQIRCDECHGIIHSFHDTYTYEDKFLCEKCYENHYQKPVLISNNPWAWSGRDWNKSGKDTQK